MPYDTADFLIARHRRVINAIFHRTVQHSGNATDVVIRRERACHREVSDDTAVIARASYDAEQSDIIVDCVSPRAVGIVIIQPADRMPFSVEHAEIAYFVSIILKVKVLIQRADRYPLIIFTAGEIDIGGKFGTGGGILLFAVRSVDDIAELF